MIRKKPAAGRDPGVDTGFPKKIMLIKDLERQSIQFEAMSI